MLINDISAINCRECGNPMDQRLVEQGYFCGGHELVLKNVQANVCGNCGNKLFSLGVLKLIQFIGHVLSLYDNPPPEKEEPEQCACEETSAKLSNIEIRFENVEGLLEEAIQAIGMRLYTDWMDKFAMPEPYMTRLTDSATRRALPDTESWAVEKRLAAYEDAGITPGRGMELAHLYRKLQVSAEEIEEVNAMCRQILNAGINPEKLAEWTKAEKEGRLRIFPRGPGSF